MLYLYGLDTARVFISYIKSSKNVINLNSKSRTRVISRLGLRIQLNFKFQSAKNHSI